MTLLAMQAPEDAVGPVAATYDAIRKTFGRIPNTFQLYSSSSALLAQQWEGVQYYMTHPTLGMALLATIRMLVSQANDCAYCVGFNESLLVQRCGQTLEQVAATKKDPAASPLGARDKALLTFVLRAVATPHAVRAEDLDALRRLGWSDRDLLDAVAHGARNVAADILFSTFKIERDY